MTARYRHARDTRYLRVDASEELRITSNWGYVVRVYDIHLTDYPDGDRSVSIEGLHIKKDGQPGSHRRTGSWDAPAPLPPALAEIVEDTRPGWWSS